jgi:hypothetical protein
MGSEWSSRPVRLQVGVEGELTAADVDDDPVAAGGFKRERRFVRRNLVRLPSWMPTTVRAATDSTGSP